IIIIQKSTYKRDTFFQSVLFIGTILEVGKKADFVILDKNPLEIPIENIKEIKVVETIKDGNTLYRIE
ncbi:amidohydrolase family protein, partial [Clostridium butyricum]|uniref:amidohydrolase family protein n=1 Tax=Clostridium butyricum TaxID=1492 RepID=UPI00374E4A2C